MFVDLGKFVYLCKAFGKACGDSSGAQGRHLRAAAETCKSYRKPINTYI